MKRSFLTLLLLNFLSPTLCCAEDDAEGAAFFEKRIRPLLIKHCYECHSEEEQESMGGLLLDRKSGWLSGGDTGKAIVPNQPNASLLIEAVRYENEDLQMPPDGKLGDKEIAVLINWVKRGAPGPIKDLGNTEFSQLGDQDLYFEQAKTHWAFQPLAKPTPPSVKHTKWNQHPIDRFIFAKLAEQNLSPSPQTDSRTLLRRLRYDLTGLPPNKDVLSKFVATSDSERDAAYEQLVDKSLASITFGENFARLWLDVARYADTDSTYRPDTKTPHYLPFAYTYRDYVIDAFNCDKPYNLFIKEQLAADLMHEDQSAPEMAALGFLTVGPHGRRASTEQIDDWIDVTSRGLMGLTVACARCHDHKYEAIPTADYYSLYGVFGSIDRLKALDEKKQPEITGYEIEDSHAADFAKLRKVIDAKIKKAGNSKAKGNNRSVAEKIRDTELAKLLTFHPGAPTHTMVVMEKKTPVSPSIFIRGDAGNRGERVPRRFLKLLDAEQAPFTNKNSGRLELAEKIASQENPLTARVFVNRIWGRLMGSHLVKTPSDFGLQTAEPEHVALLDWLTSDFIEHEWSLKHLVRTIVTSRAYQQSTAHHAQKTNADPENQWYWRANRKHLSIEQLRDSMLQVAKQLDHTSRGHAAPLWDQEYTKRRAIYGFVNRFNLDPTLRAFDFPTPMQSQPGREESIVAQQALFTMNSSFVLDQAIAVTELSEFQTAQNIEEKIAVVFDQILQRSPAPAETERVQRFIELQKRFSDEAAQRPATAQTWTLIAQSLLMSNEFQYID